MACCFSSLHTTPQMSVCGLRSVHMHMNFQTKRSHISFLREETAANPWCNIHAAHRLAEPSETLCLFFITFRHGGLLKERRVRCAASASFRVLPVFSSLRDKTTDARRPLPLVPRPCRGRTPPHPDRAESHPSCLGEMAELAGKVMPH